MFSHRDCFDMMSPTLILNSLPQYMTLYCLDRKFFAKGVPQGSFLGPVIFTISLNGCQDHLYADDDTIVGLYFIAGHGEPDTLIDLKLGIVNKTKFTFFFRDPKT